MSTRESREVRNERLIRQTARQLSDQLGIDGYAADALVRACHRDRHHPWTAVVLAAGLTGVALNAGLDVSLGRLAAAHSRAERAMAAFGAEMAATYAEMDDEFRQHPEIVTLDGHLDRFYDAE